MNQVGLNHLPRQGDATISHWVAERILQHGVKIDGNRLCCGMGKLVVQAHGAKFNASSIA